mmetsp:Transcript_31202/g.56644  ORF Transcript_31202/g.56644 Transcript_31202/m.56644 type:complete len:232 (-) Transcript_31202:129-824(-)
MEKAADEGAEDALRQLQEAQKERLRNAGRKRLEEYRLRKGKLNLKLSDSPRTFLANPPPNATSFLSPCENLVDIVKEGIDAIRHSASSSKSRHSDAGGSPSHIRQSSSSLDAAPFETIVTVEPLHVSDLMTKKSLEQNTREEDGPGVPPVDSALVEILLAQVERLTRDKSTLLSEVEFLRREVSHLTELVGYLSDRFPGGRESDEGDLAPSPSESYAFFAKAKTSFDTFKL